MYLVSKHIKCIYAHLWERPKDVSVSKLSESQKKLFLPGGESNPGLPHDRRRHSPLYYQSLADTEIIMLFILLIHSNPIWILFILIKFWFVKQILGQSQTTLTTYRLSPLFDFGPPWNRFFRCFRWFGAIKKNYFGTKFIWTWSKFWDFFFPLFFIIGVRALILGSWWWNWIIRRFN